ncbi:MAG: hypothetical protein AVDCRST_MAG77-3524 [uncultured Chloroflexi bacterium]|uniref:Uncharacterized protein n=1 Tax=uncultured Chloroflexota bacterium TaxID=166587 RepID=A0A6J4JDE7_9CHLR|nr:MAG: hypothetical protein AVDCRST_MAG77-3524 [uncultured Chloroflexota bacterium]
MLLPRELTTLWWLSDVLVTPAIPRQKVVSPGDLLIGGGLGFLAAQAMRGRVGQLPTLPESVSSPLAVVGSLGDSQAMTAGSTAIAGKEVERGVASAGATPQTSELMA